MRLDVPNGSLLAGAPLWQFTPNVSEYCVFSLSDSELFFSRAFSFTQVFLFLATF